MMENKKNKDKEDCGDKKCPFHGNLSVRGRHFQGTVIKLFEKRAVIEFEHLNYYKKYERYAKARTKLHAYLPKCLANKISKNDLVEIGECKPLSKIINFVVLKKLGVKK